MADFQSLARQKAKKYGLDPNVFERQIRQESGFNPSAVSPAGAIGIAQIMPATARGWGVNPRDPNAALDAAAKNMARYVHQYGSYRNALIAYNAGPGAVGRGSLPAETQNYIKTILGGSNPSPASARAASAQGGRSTGSTTTNLPGATFKTTVPTVDQSAFEGARRNAIIGQLIARRNPNSILLRSGLLSTVEPSLSEFMGQQTTTSRVPGKTVTVPGGPSAPSGSASASFSTPPTQSGVANFEGKKVAAWIKPALVYARAHGWKGTVNSGYRSFADQQRIYNSGVRPAAKPGTSNHEGTTFPRGAVDVSDAAQLSAILKRSPYAGRLVWAGAKDPVHFSHPHNGSY
jgi:hypothetical protein